VPEDMRTLISFARPVKDASSCVRYEIGLMWVRCSFVAKVAVVGAESVIDT
jgi:hypothetical protein